MLSLFVLGKIGWNPLDVFNRAEAQSDDGAAYLEPGLRFDNPIDTISLGLGLLLGTAGLPHILMRFFTVPDAKAARSSVVWAVGLIGVFYVMTTFLGFGARALLGEAGTTGASTRPATSPRRCWRRTSAAAPAPSAATPSWRSSPRSPSRRSSRSSRGW